MNSKNIFITICLFIVLIGCVNTISAASDNPINNTLNTDSSHDSVDELSMINNDESNSVDDNEFVYTSNVENTSSDSHEVMESQNDNVVNMNNTALITTVNNENGNNMLKTSNDDDVVMSQSIKNAHDVN